MLAFIRICVKFAPQGGDGEERLTLKIRRIARGQFAGAEVGHDDAGGFADAGPVGDGAAFGVGDGGVLAFLLDRFMD